MKVPVWNANAPRTRYRSSSRSDPSPTKIITNLNITNTGPIINCSRIKRRLHSSRKRKSLAFTVSWTRTRIAYGSSFRGLRSSMMWCEIYFSIQNKTKKTMRLNRSRRPTPWSCSNRKRTDHTCWRSRTLCDLTSQFGTFLLGCRFGIHPRWLSNIVRRPRMPNSAASTTTWSVSEFAFSFVSLHIISDVLMDPTVWAFSLAADAITHLGVPLLD